MSGRRCLGLIAVVASVALAACGQHGGEPAGPPSTTGILPSRAPTEGSRPAADGLPPAAEPQTAPPPRDPPPGRIAAVGTSPEGVVVDDATRTVAVATRGPDEVVVIDADSGAVTDRVALPGSARHLQLATPGTVLVPVETANALVRVDLREKAASPPIITGTSPHDAAVAANGAVFVGNELGGTVTALRGDHIVKVFTDSVQPAGLAAFGTAIGMIDARTNTVTVYDAEKLTIVGSAPAGAGPTHLVADRHGRMIAADTRGDTLRVFEPLPTPHEVATIAQPGGPYGVAYDGARDRLWVASSGTNQLVGYDMTRPTPREIQRIPTVQNPYSLGVDSLTGRLFVAGVSGGQVQVIDTAT
jgi:DNA-binding beta-propeller fold protein YncE